MNARQDDQKLRAAEMCRQIASILLHDWDPIGVAEVPEAHDEYDSYVGPIFRLLTQGASAEILEKHLREIETVDMGLFGMADRRTAIRKLLALRAP